MAKDEDRGTKLTWQYVECVCGCQWWSLKFGIEMECKVFPGFALPTVFFFIFTQFENARRTYSCEYFWYPTTSSLTWREALEPGGAPGNPDDGPCAKAKSVIRVSIYSSVRPSGFELLQAPTVCIHAAVWLIYNVFTRPRPNSVRFYEPARAQRALRRLAQYFCTTSRI